MTTTTWRRSLLGFALGAATIAATAGIAQASTTVRVIGTVLDGSSGKPMTGVALTVADSAGLRRSVVTDKQGRFSVIGLQFGEVTLDLEYPGFVSQTGTLTVPFGMIADCDFRFFSERSTLIQRPAQDVDQAAGPSCRLDTGTDSLYVR